MTVIHPIPMFSSKMSRKVSLPPYDPESRANGDEINPLEEVNLFNLQK